MTLSIALKTLSLATMGKIGNDDDKITKHIVRACRTANGTVEV